MNVDWKAFRRARVARDVRFDGRFFVGILSTKIYCRPSCPVPTVPDKNVRYFPTAAAATEAGFRPCMRCRPECSPGSPAWLGTPSQIRRLARVKDVQPENQYVFRLRFRPPYNWGGMLEFLALRSTPGVEIVSDDCYCRSISLNGNPGWFEVSLDENEPALITRVHFSDPRSLFVIIERVRRMFDLNADWDAIVATLRTDPILASAVKAKPGMRLPGCWDPFELAVRAILGQQVTVKGATTLAGRIARAFGEPLDSINGLTNLFPTAEALINADFSSIGLPKARAESIRALAR